MFSEQQLIDCDWLPNMGCVGGKAHYAMRYVAENGISLMKDYPYENRKGECRYEKERMSKYEVVEFKYFQ